MMQVGESWLGRRIAVIQNKAAAHGDLVLVGELRFGFAGSWDDAAVPMGSWVGNHHWVGMRAISVPPFPVPADRSGRSLHGGSCSEFRHFLAGVVSAK